MRPALLSLLLAAPAAAQENDAAPHVVVMSIGGDAPEAVAREAREAVAAALEGDGMRVLSEGDVVLRVNPARLAECRAIACAHAIGRELGVATVAAVAIWMEGERPASIAVSLIVAETRAHTAREELGARTIADAAAAAVRGSQDARARALLVEGSADPETAVEEAEQRAIPPPEPPRERSIEEYVLPAIMGAFGLALGGIAIYALLDENCERRAPSGLCLRGDRPNIGLGALTAILGGLSIAGGIVWLILGGRPPPSSGTIDVVIAPEGGGASWRATF